jgi:filamentous hemagglutinin
MKSRVSQRKRSAAAAWLPASGLTLLATTLCSAAPPPTLPIPCIAGTCGTTVTSFSGGAATATQAGNKLTVNQTANNALLNWQSFNIGKGSAVNFVQPSATSLAVNQIYQNSPSQIFGSLTANGRIYLINQNGIMFGGGAQVNVAGLVASSLNITSNALANGIAPSVTGDPTTPSFQATPGAVSGAVSVAQGATLNATGGQIFLFAPQVSNQGTITTPDGQTILAAGSAVYLAASQDPNVRGLLVAVDTGGTVTNGSAANSTVTDPSKLVGQIVAQRGNVTLMGLAVNQNGLVSANTSVRANGSILLIAADRSQGGALNLGANSVTEAPLDATDTSLAVDATIQQKSSVTLRGFDVNVASGASIVATSGTITATGSAIGVQGSTDSAPAPAVSNSDNSRIYIADGATLDASGATAVLPMSSNVLQVELRGSELADDPNQRNGALRGQTVNVDVRQHGTLADGTPWVGTPLADLSADVATIQRGVFERNETGGSVTLQSSGDVIVAPKAKVNVSGGASDYQAGFLNASSLIGANGQLYSLATASPNIVYTGVANSSSFSVTDARWGVTTVYTGFYGSQGQYVPGYAQGADAGGLTVNAPHIIFDGTLAGNVQVGPFQRNPATALLAGQSARFYDQVPLPAALTIGAGTPPPNPFTPPDLIVSSIDFAPGAVLPTLKNPDGSPFAPLTDAFPSTLSAVTLNPALIGANGAGRVELQANGTISVPAGVDLRLPTNGSFTALAATIDIAGTIEGSGAGINLQSIPTATNSTSGGGVLLQPTAVLNVAGAWVNDNPAITPAPATAPLAINGGSISINARDANVTLDPGSVLDVSGGAQLTVGGTFAAGSAGKISISSSSPDLSVPTELFLGATLRGYGFQNGGSLSVSASAFCVTAGAACATPTMGEIAVAPAFFSSGGFSSYSLDANDGPFEVTSQTQLQPVQQNFLVNTALSRTPSASSVFPLVSTGILPAFQRNPVNLAFSSEFVPAFGELTTPESFAGAPSLVLDAGSSILLDPLASLTLTSNSRILDDGLIRAPSGTVAMSVTAALAEPSFIAGHQIWLGPQATVDVSGTVVSITDDRGNDTGNVLAGGTVQLNAQRGAVELQPGSLINVSGSTATLDVPQLDSAGAVTYRSTALASAGGSVDITAAEAVLLSGTMLAASGNPALVPSGSFSLSLNGNNRYGTDVFGGLPPPYPYDPRTIIVANSQPAIAVAPGIDLPASLEGKALVSAQGLANAGFDAVSLSASTLDGTTDASPVVPSLIQFNGNVSLALARSLTLDAAGFSSDGGRSVLAAPYVSLGQSTSNTQNSVGATSDGTGSLQVNAAMIDLIGHSGYGNFATVTLNSSGDIRANGVQAEIPPGAALDPQFPGALTVSGALNLVAQQIYPSTLSSFAFTAGAGGSGNISIEAAPGTAATPLLSAGGTLSFTANQVTQAGTVRAPLGVIAMNAETITLAPGSITSTSADGQLIPFGTTQLGGVDWFYPFNGNSGLVYGTDGIPLPTQSIQLSAASVNIAKGSTVDVKGGGDLLATEFVPGPTGTVDVLGSGGAFAILPTSNLTFAPNDPYYTTGSGVSPGQSVYLSGGGGVPAGTYAILPARYALLPGAYYVSPVAGFQDLAAGQQVRQADGSVIVSGYTVAAATALGRARTSGFDIQPGTAVQNLAQYTLTDASNFFLNQAKAAGVNPQRLPQDAGTLALSATTQLTLDGTLQAAAGTGGRGADVDISSAAIRIVNDSAPPPAITGVLDLDANSLSVLGAESILLGGTRVETDAGLQITTQASSIEVTSGASLKAPELLMVASNAITLDSGATLGTSGKIATPDTALVLSGDGALLRVASNGNPLIMRADSSGSQGQVSILSGAVINAPAGSVSVDAALSATFGGTLNLTGGSLAISGTQISLGEVPGSATGIVLPSSVLAGLSLADLSLTGRNSIDFYDGANLSGTNLTLSTGALRGFGSGNLQISASDTLTLTGAATPSALAGTGTGSGTLLLQGASVSLQDGGLDISGYAATTIGSQSILNLSGAGSLSTQGNLNFQAGLLTADSGAQWIITSSGAFAYSAPTNTASIKLPAQASLGANVAINAPTIAFDSAAQLHSGTLTLNATGVNGDVDLGGAASIDVSGVATVFDTVAVPSRAGTVNLQSQFGSVAAASGSQINVAALDDTVADSGALNVQATQGSIGLNGTLLGRNAAINADARSLGNVSSLETALVNGGFSGDWSLRLRGAGDLTVASGVAISGRSVTLTADQGGIDVEGTISSSSHAGGAIGLWARDNIIVNGTLDARPNASGDANGQIELATSQGAVRVGSSAVIEAYDPTTPTQSLADGGLWIRAPQTGLEAVLSGGAPGLVLAGNLQGLRSITVEGFHTESPSTAGTLGSADVLADMSNPIYADAANFMAKAPALLSALGVVNGPAAQFVPGIEIDSNQSLTLTSTWALDQWRFNGAPGVLTLRSAGDLTFAASLTDGFTGTANILTATTPSWSYRLVAGADFNSANAMAVQPPSVIANSTDGTGSLIVAPGTPSIGTRPGVSTAIRTGTGSIDIAAATDVTLESMASVIYTAGIASEGITYSGRGQLQGLLYPTEGGDIRISAGRDVVGTPGDELATNWLWRVGTPNSRPAPTSTAWTVNFSFFEQGVAALGGGNVAVTAGRNINDLSASVPTIGQQVGGATPATSDLHVINSGDITVRAGNNVAGGTVYEGAGAGVVVAGNQITQSPSVTGLYPMVLLGDATVTLSAGAGATLAGVANPTLLPQGAAQGANVGPNTSYFSTYGSNSAVTLQTVAGTAELLNDISQNSAVISQYTTLAFTPSGNSNDASGYSALRIYPGTLSVASLRGGAAVDDTLTLYPEANGSLSLFAYNNVTLGSAASTASSFEIIESNADTSLLPTAANPQGTYQTVSDQLNSLINLDTNFSFLPPNAPAPVHLTGPDPDSTVSRIVALTGDVSAQTSQSSQVTFAAPARIVAGEDVNNLVVNFTNLESQDISAIVAGRDIDYSFTRVATGQITSAPTYIVVDGPGTLELVAGRNLNLGTSGGITSRGNLTNTGLSSGGADVTVEAGVGDPGTLNFSTFISDYLVNTAAYNSNLLAFMQPILGGTPSQAQALSAFESLPAIEQVPLIDKIFFNELLQSGTNAANPGALHNNFTQGFAAINALFPGGVPDLAQNQSNLYSGDISLYFSRIYTLDGGSINLLAPGGLVNVGLATLPSAFGITKSPSDLGVVAQSSGNVNSYSYGDFEVNESRVFAADGGNIMIWSTQGNIDAGRGSKTAISAPPPTITYVNGVPTVTFPAALTGSGIQALTTTDGVPPGNVGLFAPNGVVNANDAGIVAGNLTIAATAVLGASNIKVSGVSVGVPVEVTGLGASLAGVSAAGSSATQAATESAAANANRAAAAAPIADAALGWLDVFVEGFGADTCKPDDVECLKRQSIH